MLQTGLDSPNWPEAFRNNRLGSPKHWNECMWPDSLTSGTQSGLERARHHASVLADDPAMIYNHQTSSKPASPQASTVSEIRHPMLQPQNCQLISCKQHLSSITCKRQVFVLCLPSACQKSAVHIIGADSRTFAKGANCRYIQECHGLPALMILPVCMHGIGSPAQLNRPLAGSCQVCVRKIVCRYVSAARGRH